MRSSCPGRRSEPHRRHRDGRPGMGPAGRRRVRRPSHAHRPAPRALRRAARVDRGVGVRGCHRRLQPPAGAGVDPACDLLREPRRRLARRDRRRRRVHPARPRRHPGARGPLPVGLRAGVGARARRRRRRGRRRGRGSGRGRPHAARPGGQRRPGGCGGRPTSARARRPPFWSGRGSSSSSSGAASSSSPSAEGATSPRRWRCWSPGPPPAGGGRSPGRRSRSAA